jgi:deoxyribose-phosphate aldolase
MVIDVGRHYLDRDWSYVDKELRAVNNVVTQADSILKVTFENDYMSPAFTYICMLPAANITKSEIIKLCELCNKI